MCIWIYNFMYFTDEFIWQTFWFNISWMILLWLLAIDTPTPLSNTPYLHPIPIQPTHTTNLHTSTQPYTFLPIQPKLPRSKLTHPFRSSASVPHPTYPYTYTNCIYEYRIWVKCCFLPLTDKDFSWLFVICNDKLDSSIYVLVPFSYVIIF